MKDRYEIRLAGEGGQGLVLAGVILAEAASIFDGKNATQTQSYGPESRGGASRSEVIISDQEIDYPKCVDIDLLLLFTNAAAEKYMVDVPEHCLILVDSDLVTVDLPESTHKVVKAPITRIATEQVGRHFVANIVAVGLLNGLAKIVTDEALEKAVLDRVPPGTEELNKKALQLGMEAALEYGKKHILEVVQ